MKSRRPLWLTIIAIILFLGAISLPFLPDPGWKFWKTSYIAYLMALMLLPLLLMRNENKKSLWIRRVVLITTLALFGFLQWACPRPVGTIELLIISLMKGKPILIYGLKLGLLIGLTAVFGRYFCGWICPKGTLQELVHIPQLFKVPRKLDRILKYGKYLTLIALIAAPLVWEYRLFREIGPFKVLFNLNGSVYLLAFLVVTLLTSVFIGRAFCRYFCPIGGLLGIISAISPNQIRINSHACIGCGHCSKICPVDALVQDQPRSVPKLEKLECIACKQCESSCPKACLTMTANRKYGA